MSTTSEAAGAPANAAEGVHVWKGLLWREWLAHRGLVVNALAAWLVCGWVLLIFFHPGFIIAFGVLYALVAGPAFGGAEAAEGSEEFSFSLPPTRAERYLVRLALGAGTVLGFSVLGVVAIALDLPQMLWGLAVSSGFTEPFPPCEAWYVYALAIAVPFAVFSFSFAIAAAAATRGLVAVSWLVGGLCAAGILSLGFGAEALIWREGINGCVSPIALLAAAPIALLWGYLACQRKEGISRPAPPRGHGLWWVWLLVVIFVLLAFLFMWRRAGVDRAAPGPSRPIRVESPRR